MTQPLRPALFLDRDGVINVEVNYLYRPEDCILMDGIASLLRTARSLGYIICVVTNQAGIGRGLYTDEDFHRLMAHIALELSRVGAAWDAVYFSPFHPRDGQGEYRRESHCRKPAPGMLLRAAAEHPIDLSKSIMVGDRCSDLQAGCSAGIQKLFLFGKTESAPCPGLPYYRHVQALSSVEQELNTTSNKG